MHATVGNMMAFFSVQFSSFIQCSSHRSVMRYLRSFSLPPCYLSIRIRIHSKIRRQHIFVKNTPGCPPLLSPQVQYRCLATRPLDRPGGGGLPPRERLRRDMAGCSPRREVESLHRNLIHLPMMFAAAELCLFEFVCRSPFRRGCVTCSSAFVIG